MAGFDEKMLEDYVVEKLQENGWKFIPATELERESYEEPLLIENLKRKLKELNKGIEDEEIDQVIKELKRRTSGVENTKKILEFFKFGMRLKSEKEQTLKNVEFFDFKNIGKNEFIVTRQVPYHGKDDIRTDIMLYVNGIPLVNIELKNPASFSESWYDAYRQIKDYEKTVPELYKYVQIGVAAEQIAMYFPIVPWQDEVNTYEWKEKSKDPVDSTIEMLSPDKILDIIRNYLFFREEFGSATKVIARYMQYRASEKIVNRVLKNLEGVEARDKGLIWHWQGSGKTLTMIFAANKLYHDERLENPTIFFIVDRIELEDQLYQEFGSLDITEPEIIGSIKKLKNVLEHDEGRGKRGIMIVLIHKFRPQELRSLQEELEGLSKYRETILTRKNVVAFIDEGHRTQYGIMAAQMKKILRSAFFFAFTGTPIAKVGRDTYREFSYFPEEKYLDRYFITDSIKDGFTVRIVYQPRLEGDVHLKRDMLQTFLEVEFEEIPESIREDVEEGVKERLNIINLFLENRERIGKIASDIAEHFKENVDGKFKAMVVASSRKACIYYKRELDKHLPREYSEVVMTYNRGDPKVIRDYEEELRERYAGKDIDDIRKEIIEKFKEEEYPKILIVTDMLLTGFDAPILQTMYLDKPLKEHRLLQAIARINRPYKDLKEAGVVIDYIGILSEFKRAFEIYSKEDIKGALYNLENLKEEFKKTLRELLGIFEDIPKDEYYREVLLEAVENLTRDDEKTKKFLHGYRELRRIFELIGSDKIDFFSEYKWLSAIYSYYMRALRRPEPLKESYIKKYFDKTIKYVHRTTELENIKKDLPVIEFDENYLDNLKRQVKSKEERAANIVFTLNRFILVERHKSPVYESLVSRVEKILESWKEKSKNYEEIYKEGTEIIKEIEKSSKRQKELEFSNIEYSILLSLERRFKDKSLVNDVKELYENLKDYIRWINQKTVRKKIEREIRSFIRKKYYKKYGMSPKELDELHKELIEDVINYANHQSP
ncbi:MAG: type restriction enzyme subunit [Methanobacteriaceae archaeon]|nr:type restriction enzyme subunit [Methanobacteriaceae archaeon]